MKILIAGDFCPSGRTVDLIENKQYDAIFSDIIPVLKTVDYSVVNFECPVGDNITKAIDKVGPNLKCSSSGLDAIKYVGFDMVTLANNHFYDYGDSGVENTINYCKSNDIDYVGGGMNIHEAEKICYKTIDSKKIAFINICENEFSIASELTAGSNPLNPIRNFYKIKEAKENADYVVLIVHGGHEYYQLPSPRMRDTYRFFIDCGADVVVNHHQHCYSGYEKYKGKMIFYGLGNFCFDALNRVNHIWNEGYLLVLDFDSEIDFNLLPYTQCNEMAEVKLLNDENREMFMQKISELNKIVSDDALLVGSFDKFIKQRSQMLSWFEPYQNKYLSALYHRGFLPSLLNKKKWILYSNLIRCESHRDILLNLMSGKIKN